MNVFFSHDRVLGAVVRFFRESAQLSQSDISGIKQHNLSRIENGLVAVKIDQLETITRALPIKTWYLIMVWEDVMRVCEREGLFLIGRELPSQNSIWVSQELLLRWANTAHEKLAPVSLSIWRV